MQYDILSPRLLRRNPRVPRKAEHVSKDVAHLAYGIRQERGAPHVCTSLTIGHSYSYAFTSPKPQNC
jgi:hypothetical protein